MSSESQAWLDEFVLVGNVSTRGLGWHQRYTVDGLLPKNAFDGMIPFGSVANLFDRHSPAESPITLNATGTIVDGKKAVYNQETGDVFGIFADSYVIHPFRNTLLDTTAELMGSDLGITSAGLLKNGAVGWLQLEMPAARTIDGLPDETYKLSILAAS